MEALGTFDIGQAAVVCDGLVLAVEAAEGTDAMIARVGTLPENIRGTPRKRRGVLIKARKPTQDGKTDLPGNRCSDREECRGNRPCRNCSRGRIGSGRKPQSRRAKRGRSWALHFGLPIDAAIRIAMSADGRASLKLMLVCGEPSGDQLGAQLMGGLRTLAGDKIQFVGVGGPAMAANGLKSLFPIDVTSVMGLRSIVPRLPEILRRIRMASDFALAARPDALVCIDSPEFTHRIAKRLRRMDANIPTVNYVAPQVWASRAYRAGRMARYFDLVLALLPFEVGVLRGAWAARTVRRASRGGACVR